MQKIVNTDALIKDNISIYNEREQDNPEYINILNTVKEELSQGITLTEATLNKIINWLLPPLFRSHVKRGLKLYGINKYAEVMDKALKAPDDQKLSTLVELYGIGPVTGSTLLHFTDPSKFPIMNKKVVKTLYRLGRLKEDSISTESYAPFCKVIHDISQKFGYELRDIDKALFECAVNMKLPNLNYTAEN